MHFPPMASQKGVEQLVGTKYDVSGHALVHWILTAKTWVLAWDNLLRRIGVRRRWLDSWTSILKKNCGVPKSEDIPRATDEAHPRHNVAGES
jgi:hypothetical protein